MDDVRLRLEDLQDLSRKFLERRGLVEGGCEVQGSLGRVGLSAVSGPVLKAAREGGGRAQESEKGAEVINLQGEGN